MKDREINYHRQDPFDPDTLYSDLVGKHDRVFMHKIVSRKVKSSSKPKSDPSPKSGQAPEDEKRELYLLIDSKPMQEGDVLIKDFEKKSSALYSRFRKTRDSRSSSR